MSFRNSCLTVYFPFFLLNVFTLVLLSPLLLSFIIDVFLFLLRYCYSPTHLLISRPLFVCGCILIFSFFSPCLFFLSFVSLFLSVLFLSRLSLFFLPFPCTTSLARFPLFFSLFYINNWLSLLSNIIIFSLSPFFFAISLLYSFLFPSPSFLRILSHYILSLIPHLLLSLIPHPLIPHPFLPPASFLALFLFLFYFLSPYLPNAKFPLSVSPSHFYSQSTASLPPSLPLCFTLNVHLPFIPRFCTPSRLLPFFALSISPSLSPYPLSLFLPFPTQPTGVSRQL